MRIVLTTVTRSHTAAPTRDPDAIAARAVALIDRTEAGKRPVRLIGVGLHGLSSAEKTAPPLTEAGDLKLPFE